MHLTPQSKPGAKSWGRVYILYFH